MDLDHQCACASADANHRQFEQARSVGVDETHGRYANVSILRCIDCGAHWLRYFVEYEAFSRSGRWARGGISTAEAALITPAEAPGYLERLPIHLCGGSFFDGRAQTWQGPFPWDVLGGS